MDIKIQIKGFCSSGNHIYITATIGTKTFSLVTSKSELKSDSKDWESEIILALKYFINKSGLTDWTQIKTAIESEIFKI